MALPPLSVAVFEVADRAAGAAALGALAERFETAPEPVPPRVATYFDTFDWRVHEAGGRLLRTELGDAPPVLVWERRDGAVEARASGAAEPGFAASLPAGRLRGGLGPLLGVRRLLPRVRVESEAEVVAVAGSKAGGKTVARVELVLARSSLPGGEETALAPRLVVRSLRGFERQAAVVVAFLAEVVGRPAEPADELAAALAVHGRTPGDYSSKLDLELAPEVTAGEAARKAHLFLIGVVAANEDGVRRDLDPEFLHDLRVAVRRARSALGQVRGVFPPGTLARFKAELGWLGKRTGPCRDADVLLLGLPAATADLPAPVRRAFLPLVELAAERRAHAHARLVRDLESPRYRRLVAGWRAYLEADAAAGDGTPNAEKPAREVAAKRIAKLHRRLLGRGAAVGDGAESAAAAELHRLRIDAKKLRYLLELFRRLFDVERVDEVVGELKRLQDVLGEHHDAVVQQGTLADLAGELHGRGAGALTLLAAGRLVERLARAEEAAAAAFAERMARFAEAVDRKRMRALLGS